jgi:hypothetical protein
VLFAQADEVADLADAEPGVCAAFVHSLGLPDLKAKKLLKALGVAQGEVCAAMRRLMCCHYACVRVAAVRALQAAPAGAAAAPTAGPTAPKPAAQVPPPVAPE